MSNEERFIAGCVKVGDSDVRQKLNAGRYEGRKADWASNWLEQLEGAKSDVPKTEESSLLRDAAQGTGYSARLLLALLFVLLAAGLAVFLKVA